MGRRSNTMIGLGLAVFALGVAAVLFLLKDDGGQTVAGAATPDHVLVATDDIPRGATADDIVAQGLVELRQLPAEAVSPDAVTSAAQLDGKRFVAGLRSGEQVRSSALASQTLRGGAVQVPEGKEGMAVRVPFVPAGAGYVGTGDRVNVYAVISEGGPVTRILDSVEVLDVSIEIAPRRASAEPSERASGDSITYLLAVDAAQAQQLAFLVSNESVYLTLARTDPAAVAQPAPAVEQ